MTLMRIHLTKWNGDDIMYLTVTTGKTSKRIILTDDEAQHISNRLQSFAKGNMGTERLLDKDY